MTKRDNPMIGETIKNIKYGNPMIIEFESGDSVEFEFCLEDGKPSAMVGYKNKQNK